MRLELTDNGSALGPEALVLAAGAPALHSGQRTENIALDSEQVIHAVWTAQGMYGPVHQAFNSSGWPIGAPSNLSPMAQRPHAPSLAAGTNGRPYVSYENELEDRVEMAYLTPNGSGYDLHTGYLAGKWANGSTIAVDGGGRPHILYKNATNGGLYHTRFSAQGSLEIDSSFIFGFGGGFGPGSALPRIAFGPDGAMHLLLASRVNGTRSLYYCKLDNAGNRLADPVEVSDSAGDPGDICVGPDNAVHIVWGQDDDRQVHHVSIGSGSENGTLSPVAVSATSGRAGDPACAVSAEGAVGVAWADTRDGDAEIYFRAGLVPGIAVRGEGPYLNTMHLQELLDYPVTVRNTGLTVVEVRLNLTFAFNATEVGIGPEYNGTGWKLWLDPAPLVLAPREERRFPVHVRSPLSGSTGFWIVVTLTADGGFNGTAPKKVSFRPYLQLERRIEIESLPDFRETAPGMPAQFVLTVRTWDLHDEVRLLVSQPACWTASLDDTTLKLGPWDSAVTNLTVVPPADAFANETGTTTITAVSAIQPDVKNHTSVRVRIPELLNVSISPERAEETVLPGKTAEFSLEVVKSGNVPGATEVRLEAGDVPGGWNATLGTTVLQMYPGQSSIVALRLRAPDSALAGDRAAVEVRARDAFGRLLDSCAVRATVDAFHKLIIWTGNFTVQALPGGTASAAVFVRNDGNAPEALTPGERILPEGWNLWLRMPDGSAITGGRPAVLPPRSLAELRLEVAVPADSLADTYFVTATLGTANGTELRTTVYVEVLRVVSVSAAVDRTSASVRPGGTARFTFTAMNSGNLEETLEFNLSGLPTGWRSPAFRTEAGTLTNVLDVPAFGSARMLLDIAVPEDAVLEGANLLAGVRSMTNFTASFVLELDILGQNIALAGLAFEPRKPVPGDKVHFRLQVSNTGDVEIGHVVMAVLDGENVLEWRDLGLLEPGMGWVFEFDWMASAGKHTLRFRADPNGTVAERNETDNLQQVTITVEAEKKGGPEPGQAAAAAAGAVAVVAALVLLLRRRRRAGAGGA
jgi:uncharacterized membrane protein